MVPSAIARAAVPPLNQMQELRVVLPLYQIQLLEHVAKTEQGIYRAPMNASDVLERQLLDLASSADPEELERAIPGFREALHFASDSPNDSADSK